MTSRERSNEREQALQEYYRKNGAYKDLLRRDFFERRFTENRYGVIGNALLSLVVFGICLGIFALICML